MLKQKKVVDDAPTLAWTQPRFNRWMNNHKELDDIIDDWMSGYSSHEFCLKDFPSCCAFQILGNFPDEKGLRVSVRNLQAAISSLCKRRGLVMATTIKSQKKAVKALYNVGFRPLREFQNPNTRNIVTLWFAKA